MFSMQEPYLLIFSGLWRREKYYHTDHLGSATLITDDAADVVQQIAYLPYGEDWVDVRHHGYFGSAYKFNGKEKDDETGYSYYGARYYTDRLSIWLSVDPLADKYPHLSSYAYCADNPVRYVDPDGRDPIYAKKFWGGVRKIGDDGKCGSGSYLVRGSIARDVKAATRAGEFYSGDLSQGNNVMHIPTGERLDGVLQLYDKTKNSGRENGGHANIGDKAITNWNEGGDAYIKYDENGGKQLVSEIDIFVVGDESVMFDISNMDMYFHIHNDVEVENLRTNPEISKQDFLTQKDLESKGYKGNAFIISEGDKKVRFYNGDKQLMKIRLKDFIKMGEQRE